MEALKDDGTLAAIQQEWLSDNDTSTRDRGLIATER